MATATREMTFLLAAPERRLLRAMAARIPRLINSNHLTGLGVLAAVGCGAAYALSGSHTAWLWVASGMLVVNWFGDSLDGTLARVRHTERPWYGYYLDHIVDAFSTAVVGIGIGLSPFVSLELALLLVVLYLALSINVYLESHVFGVFRMAYGWVGPTEVRIILILANTLLALGLVGGAAPLVLIVLAANAVAVLLVAGMLGTLAVRFGKNLTRLAKMDPQKRVA
jgi:phosphatidylglycerophosphate synthase